MKSLRLRWILLLYLEVSRIAASAQSAPVASIDVAKVSSPYAAAVALRPFAAPVAVNFLGEDILVVSSVDGIDTPTSAALQDRLIPEMHLTLDFFEVAKDGLRYSGRLRLPTDSSGSGISTLRDGNFLVSVGSRILKYGKDRSLLQEAAVEDICGLDERLPADFPYTVHLFTGSDEVAVANLVRVRLGSKAYKQPGPRIVGGDSHYCWFSVADLKPLKDLRSSGLGTGRATAHGMTLYLAFPGHTKSVTPEGITEVPIPAGCKLPDGITDLRITYLLRAEKAVAFGCSPGKLRISRNGIADETISLGNGLPYVETDAWNAPILIASTKGNLRGGAGRFSAKQQFIIVNYDTGTYQKMPMLKWTVQSTIYSGTPFAIAISSDGRSVAQLSGPTLSVVSVSQDVASGARTKPRAAPSTHSIGPVETIGISRAVNFRVGSSNMRVPPQLHELFLR
jgi:hypothetical protein